MSDFACNMQAIGSDDRQRHIRNIQQVFQTVQAIDELANGYTFRMPYSPKMLHNLAEFIEFERLCCPFFGFALEIGPDAETLWLRLTGGEGVKPFIQTEFSDVLSKSLFASATMANTTRSEA